VGYKKTGAVTTAEPSFVVYVQNKIPAGNLSRSQMVPKKLDGLNTDVVEIGVVKMLGARTSRSRPCQPGVSIGHYNSSAGTFGAVVKDKQTGELMILSNNHVLANGSSFQQARAKVGDPILQPGPYDGGTLDDRVGTLYRYVPLGKNIFESDCPVAAAVARGGNKMLGLVRQNYEIRFYKRDTTENTVDCAVAKIDDRALVQAAILEIGAITGVAEAKPGTVVQKSGRTSGVSSGEIKSVGTTLQVEMGNEEKVWFTDQVVTEMSSQPGDSGSLVLDRDRKAVGLLFAGSDKMTVFNRITNVIDRLEVEF